jgi:hydrogenase nickel incorporation protein HypB
MNDRPFDVISIKSRITADNDAIAAEVRELMKEKKIFFMNLMASPGAGKTTTLVRTINSLKDKYRIGVIEADVDSTVDAQAIHETGVKVIQVHNGGSCHMDADMTVRGIRGLGMDDLDVVFLENIGNMVCPAEFDVGASSSVMILSVPEGDDKPLKYPLMFTIVNCLLINKIDTMPIFDFNMDALMGRVHELNPNCRIIPVSSLTGEGLDAWISWLTDKIDECIKD